MIKYIILLVFTTSCIIPRNAEDRCVAAGLEVDSLKITEYPDKSQFVKADCIKKTYKID